MLKSQLSLIYFPALQGKVTISPASVVASQRRGCSDYKLMSTTLLHLVIDVSGDWSCQFSLAMTKNARLGNCSLLGNALLKLAGIRVQWGLADWREGNALLNIFSRIMSLQQMGFASSRQTLFG